jgi:hypothetical protein
MKPTMPVITLLAGAVLGGGVLVASVLATSTTPPASGTEPSPAAAGHTVTLPSPGSSGTVVTLPSPGSYGTVVTLPSPGSPGTVVALPSSGSPGTVVALSSPGSSGTVVTQPAPSSTGTAATQPAPSSPPTVAAQTAAPTAASTAPSATASTYVPVDADYGAQAPGGDAAVAVSVHGNHAVAYVCDGHQVGQWFNGTAQAGTLDLTGSNGARLALAYRDTGAAGYVTADGQRYAFSAPALHGHRYGLYESTGVIHGAKIKAGWIELPYGTPVGAVEYLTDGAVPLVSPAPALDLATGTAQYDGVILVATLISGVTGSGF